MRKRCHIVTKRDNLKSMDTQVVAISSALLGLAVGVVGSLSFYWSQRKFRPEPDSVHEDRSGYEDTITLLETIPQHYILLNAENRVERASTQAYSYGIVNKGKIARPEFSQLVNDVQATGNIANGKMRIKRSTLKNQQDTSLNVYATPLSQGRTLVLFEDNTAKIKLEETRRDFVSNVSHELKTPIGAIALLAETIRDVADEPELVRKFSRNLRKESARLHSLVQDIIELSRLQEGDALGKSELIVVDDVIREAVDRMVVDAQDRDVTIVTSPPTGLKIYGDSGMLTTAIRNLLDNAVRYSPIHGQVSITSSLADGQVRISVVDQGEGIDPAVKDRIFERFYRGDSARARNTGGSGLGLAIVKHVVLDHGGRIKLWSQPGVGSTFTICLPQASEPKEQSI